MGTTDILYEDYEAYNKNKQPSTDTSHSSNIGFKSVFISRLVQHIQEETS